MPEKEIIINSSAPKFPSSIGFKYPAHRDDSKLCPDLWLEDKRTDDGAEGLWRIHNKLYDLSEWIDVHPGGRDWIRLTKGTDITEAFESHHVSNTAEELLPKFYIREALEKRNPPYTFKENGFYRTLKKRINNELKNIPESVTDKTKLMTDSLFVSFIFTAILSAILKSYTVGFISGITLSLLITAAHNYFHQKDSFRMYYFDFSFLSSREWRISHALSHHLYTNTINDLEISLPQPFLFYLPSKDHLYKRIISLIISPGFYFLLLIGTVIKRYILITIGVVKEINATEVLPYIVPVIMYLVSNQSIIDVILRWLWIISVASFFFGLLGVNAAHHHPEIFHDGDTPRKDLDWGLAQVDAVMDRHEITGSPFLVLTTFGDHTLHHLFPTIDHGKLEYLYPVMKETFKEFGIEFRITSQWDLMLGQYFQLIRLVPNPYPPGVKWRWYRRLIRELRNGLKNSLRFFNLKTTNNEIN